MLTKYHAVATTSTTDLITKLFEKTNANEIADQLTTLTENYVLTSNAEKIELANYVSIAGLLTKFFFELERRNEQPKKPVEPAFLHDN